MKTSLLPLRVVLLMLPLLLPAAAWAQSGSSTTVTVSPGGTSNSTLVVDPGKVGTWTLQAVSGYHIVSSDYSVNPDSTIWTGSNPVYKAVPGPNSVDADLAAQVKGLLAPDGLPGGGGSGPPPELTFTANLDVVKADLDGDTDNDGTISHSEAEDDAEDEVPGMVVFVADDSRPASEWRRPITLTVTRRACRITWTKSSENFLLYADESCTNTTLPTTIAPGATVTIYAKGVTSSATSGGDWLKAECKPTAPVDGTNEVATDKMNLSVAKIVLKDGPNLVNPDDYVYISPDPHMPQLSAALEPVGLAGQVEWQLYIEYTRPNRGTYPGDKEYYPGPDQNGWKVLPAAEVWNIDFGATFRGGKAILTCRHAAGLLTLTFHIRGHNPPEASARAYLDANGPWYAYPIAKHESGRQNNRTYIQFNELGRLGPGPEDYRHCPNRGGGGTPYGWGMMQLDNIELPGATGYRQPGHGDPWAQELWSWKACCDTGIQVLARKQEIARAYLRRLAPDGGGGYIMPPTITVSGVQFRTGTPRTPDQLETIKRYNGNRFYLAYNRATGAWTHVRLQSEGAMDKDYTEKVMDQYED